jgi:hypothetical protein
MTSFILLSPNFFFLRQRSSTKGSARALFFGLFLWPFFFKIFFNHRGILVGALPESKILKMSGHVRKPQKLGTLYRKAGLLYRTEIKPGARVNILIPE